MKQIYTKTGDEGMTSLRGGVRVAKDDVRIETNGQLDLLCSHLGEVRAMMDAGEARGLIYDVQRELMVIMSHVATPDGAENPRQHHAVELTQRLEQAIDSLRMPTGFVVPGETLLSARLHVARAQARTAERRLWTLHRDHPQRTDVLRLMNRLSDYLFALAVAYEPQNH